MIPKDDIHAYIENNFNAIISRGLEAALDAAIVAAHVNGGSAVMIPCDGVPSEIAANVVRLYEAGGWRADSVAVNGIAHLMVK